METSSKKENYDPEYFVKIKQVDVELFGLNAAAILSVIRAGEKWRAETNQRNKTANDIAEMHGDARWLPEDVSLGFTNQKIMERTFGICGRNGVIDALKILQSSGVVTHHTNLNKKYSSDKSRYFQFHQEVYDRLVLQLKKDKKNPTPPRPPQENRCAALGVPAAEDKNGDDDAGRLNLNDSPFKNKREKEGCCLNLNGTRLNPVLHIKNSNNKYKNNNKSINAREEIDSAQQEKFHQQDEIAPILTALMKKGMPKKRFYPDAIDKLHQLYRSGATTEVFIEAYDLSVRATQGSGFGVPYLIKVVEDILAKKQSPNAHGPPRDKPKDQFSNTVYESDVRNAMKWMKGETHAND